MQRYGQVIHLRPEKYEEYKKLHAAIWPQVLATISQCHISNYTIFHRDGYLFAYFEYTGSNFEKDMALMADDPVTQQWWKLCNPCQKPVGSAAPGVWWADMEELFHAD